MPTKWLSPVVLEWIPVCSLSTSYKESEWNCAYDLWKHGERLLVEATDEHYLADGLITLKRCIEHRSQHLNKLYSFERIPLRDKPRRLLELLAFFGIVKPLMLKKLIDIRNAIEHENARPPEKERCFELLEFTWYFLRATDALSRRVPQEVWIDQPRRDELDGDYGVHLRSGPEFEWKIEIGALLESSLLSGVQRDGWIELELDSFGKAKQPNDVTFTANIKEDSSLRKILDLYFSSL